MKRALVIAVTRLGDLIQTEPMLRALRRSGEADQVTLLIEKSFRPVAEALEGVDDTFVIDFEPLLGGLDARVTGLPLDVHSKLASWLSRSQFDSVYNVTHTRPSMIMARLASQTANGVTLDANNAQVVRNPWLQYFFATNLARPWSSFNLIDVYVNAVDPATEFAARRPTLTRATRLPAASVNWNDIEIVIHAGASQSDKQWPLERFVALSKVLLERGATVTLIGGAKSTELSDAFPRHRKFCDRLGETSVADLQKLFSRVSLLVSADSGPVHVAAACGLQVIAIEGGSAHGFETAPYIEGAYVIQPHLERLFERIPNKIVTSASAERVSVKTVLSIIDSHFEQNLKLSDSPGCTIYRTKHGSDSPGLELETLSGANRFYDEWQQALQRFWWRSIGPESDRRNTHDCELRERLCVAKRAAKRVEQAGSDVRQLEDQAAALTAAERALGKELMKHPQLHHVNHFLQIARSSIGGNSIHEMAIELESIYERLASGVGELQPMLHSSSTFDFSESKHKEAVS